MAEKKMIDMGKAHAQIMDSFITAFETVLEQIEEQCVSEAQNEWISVNDKMPYEFISVLGHMTDAGELPDIRECYLVGNAFFFPALREVHPVDYWMPLPVFFEEERQ